MNDPNLELKHALIEMLDELRGVGCVPPCISESCDTITDFILNRLGYGVGLKATNAFWRGDRA